MAKSGMKVYEVKRPKGIRWRIVGYANGVRRSFGEFDSEDEARRKAAALESRVTRSRKTLAVIGKAWLDYRELDGAHRDIKTDRNRWKNHVENSFIFEMDIRKIEPRHVKKWLDELKHKQVPGTSRKISASTLSRCRSLLSACMRYSVETGHIKHNPVRDISTPKITKRDVWTWLSLSEIESVERWRRLSQKEYAHAESFFVTAIYSGLRKGELFGLRWENVDLGQNACLSVLETNTGETKNQRSYRTVPLFDPAKAALLKWRDRGGVRKQWGLVWPGSTGSPRKRDDVAGWHTCRKDLQLDRDHPYPDESLTNDGRLWPRIHDLRHTCASHLVQGSWGTPWTLEEVGRLLGHSDISTTAIYAHLSPDYLTNISRQKIDFSKNREQSSVEVGPPARNT